MAKTEIVRAHVDTELKREAERIFSALGLSPTEAIRLFYKAIPLFYEMLEAHRGLSAGARRPQRGDPRGHPPSARRGRIEQIRRRQRVDRSPQRCVKSARPRNSTKTSKEREDAAKTAINSPKSPRNWPPASRLTRVTGPTASPAHGSLAMSATLNPTGFSSGKRTRERLPSSAPARTRTCSRNRVCERILRPDSASAKAPRGGEPLSARRGDPGKSRSGAMTPPHRPGT